MSSEEELLRATRFRVVRVVQATERGPRPREIIRHPGSVTIVPLLDRDRVCLIRNLRVAVGKRLLELPAGTREPGEPVAETAQRELREETGYQARHWHRLPGFFVSPGILDERMELFLATELTAQAPEREVGEDIENAIMTWDEIDGALRDGTIEDAKTIVGLCHARRWLADRPGT